MLILLSVACTPQRAEQVPSGDPNQSGPYAVGVTTLTLEEMEGDQDVPVEIWYPAADVVDEAFTTYLVGDYALDAAAFRDVPPDPTAPQFLILFSHGLGGFRQQNYSMAERLASYGFVVAAPDHLGTTTNDFLSYYGAMKEPILHRPGTIIGVADVVMGGAVEGITPDPGGYGLIGHSLGSVTAMVVSGSALDPSAYTTICGGEGAPSVCEVVGSMELSEEELDGLPDPDTRVISTLLQSPAAQFAMVPASMQNIPRPFIEAGDLDDPTTTSEPTFDMLQAGAKMAMYEGGGHDGPTNICDLPTANIFAPDCGGVADGYGDPEAIRALAVRHVVAWMGVEVGQQPSFGDYLAPGEGYDWREK